MLVSLDVRRCGGHGDCTVTAPEVFAFLDDDDDVVSVVDAEPAEELRNKVQIAADCCPTQSITVSAP